MTEPAPADDAAARGGSPRDTPVGARRRRRRRDVPIEERAEAMRERVYATFTGLAIVLVQQANVDHITATRAALTLLVGIVAISAAGFVAAVIAHLSVHAAFPDRHEVGRMLRVAGTALATASVPLVMLTLAAVGAFDLEDALRAASILYLVTLGLIGLVAVGRTRVEWWKQLIALGGLVALGLGVVLLQQLAHGI